MVNVEDNFIISWIGRFYQMSVPKLYSMCAQGFCTVLQEGLQDRNDFHNSTKMLFAFLTV